MSAYSQPRPIVVDDDLSEFDCGEAGLNEYLHNRALKNDVGGASRCYVTLRDDKVVGYYALAMASVQHAAMSGKFRRNMPNPIPVVLLSRLATDREHQGRDLGASLLRDAITKAVEVSRIIGARCILVHALNNDAAEFYRHFEFQVSPTDPNHLVLLMKDAEKLAVAACGPGGAKSRPAGGGPARADAPGLQRGRPAPAPGHT